MGLRWMMMSSVEKNFCLTSTRGSRSLLFRRKCWGRPARPRAGPPNTHNKNHGKTSTLVLHPSLPPPRSDPLTPVGGPPPPPRRSSSHQILRPAFFSRRLSSCFFVGLHLNNIVNHQTLRVGRVLSREPYSGRCQIFIEAQASDGGGNRKDPTAPPPPGQEHRCLCRVYFELVNCCPFFFCVAQVLAHQASRHGLMIFF